jgi:tRNA-guanine family transglycosylase
MSAATLISHHNLAFYLNMMRLARDAIKAGTYGEFKYAFLAKLRENQDESV